MKGVVFFVVRCAPYPDTHSDPVLSLIRHGRVGSAPDPFCSLSHRYRIYMQFVFLFENDL